MSERVALPCSVDGCPQARNARGMCKTHDRRTLAGAPLDGSLYWWKFDRKVAVDPDSGCWNWLGHVSTSGYGTFGSPPRYAHRLSYERHIGPIPDGLTIDHLCRNTLCCNPSHLEPVTLAENVARGNSPGAIATRTNKCMRGHEYTPENTYVRPDGQGRTCLACVQLRRKAMA